MVKVATYAAKGGGYVSFARRLTSLAAVANPAIEMKFHAVLTVTSV